MHLILGHKAHKAVENELLNDDGSNLSVQVATVVLVSFALSSVSHSALTSPHALGSPH